MTSLRGFLIFQGPNPHTRVVNCGRPLYFLEVPFGLGFLTDQERMCVGTRCGTMPFSMARVSDYEDYKRGLITDTQIIAKYNLPSIPNVIQKFWFGDLLVTTSFSSL